MSRTESQVAVPPATDGPSLADWAESAILIEQRRHLSRSALRQRLRNAIFLDDDVELHLDLLLNEVSRRHHISSPTYPFEETALGLSLRPDDDHAPYEFLLWLSVSPRYRDEGRFDEIDMLFDKFVKHALLGYLGPGARAVRFAHPSSDGRPRAFPHAIAWLADLLNLGTGASVPRPRRKDGGVDVVAWRPFRDARSAFAVILCQCTAQRDWVPKAKDIVVGQWTGWIDFGLNPLTALAIPFAVGNTFDRWDEVRRTVNLILDRLRLCELIRPEELDNLEEIRTWAQLERATLGVSPEG